jgi:hypothetical protein
MRRLRKKRGGFTFIETILSVIMVGVLAGVAAKILISGLDVYSLIVNRNNAFHTARVGMDRMVDELVEIRFTDITWMSSTRLSFRDRTGSSTNFRTATVSRNGLTVPCINRGDDYLVGNVSDFDFDYFKQDGSAATFSWQLGVIDIDLEVEAPGEGGRVHLRTAVFPRSFMYDDFD